MSVPLTSNVVFNTPLATAQSLTASFTTPPFNITSAQRYAIQASYSITNTSAESISVQACVFDAQNVWDTIQTFTLPNGSNQHFLLNVENPAYKYVQLTYTPTNATAGSITIQICGKI